MNQCIICNEEFETSPEFLQALGFASIPKKCGYCAAKEKGRDRLPLEREVLQEWKNVLLLIPDDAFEVEEIDQLCLRAVYKGNFYKEGSLRSFKRWTGRLDIFLYMSNVENKIPKWVDVRLMKVTHFVQSKNQEETFQYLVLTPSENQKEGSNLVLQHFQGKVKQKDAKIHAPSRMKQYFAQWMVSENAQEFHKGAIIIYERAIPTVSTNATNVSKPATKKATAVLPTNVTNGANVSSTTAPMARRRPPKRS